MEVTVSWSGGEELCGIPTSRAENPLALTQPPERDTATPALPLVSFKMFFSVTQERYQGSEIRDDPTETQIPQKCLLFLEEFPFPCLLPYAKESLQSAGCGQLCALAWVPGLTHPPLAPH